MASRPTYKLSCSLLGHSMDVRCVATTTTVIEAGCATVDVIVTGSRDRTVKVWTPMYENSAVGYCETRTLCGHTNFVSCVCFVPPDEEFPSGLVLTGSNDKTICAFAVDSTAIGDGPVYRLTGHDNTVCSLDAGKFGTIVSGSWDQTARVWLNRKCVLTLRGHSATIWAVSVAADLRGAMLTASADKTIKMWKAGQCQRTYEGHTDCVRALAVVSELEFLSAANDGTVRRWLFDGDCVSIILAHDSYVYGIALLPSGGGFVTVGEDRTLRIWNDDGERRQIVRHPAQSVWSVAVLRNGDLVSGSSDGVARVFSCDPERQASAEELTAFEEEVGGMALSSGELGNIKINELPGKEVLYEPGKRDGQTKLVRDGSKVGVYQWVGAEARWMKIGDAVGAAGTQTPGSKVPFQGKEYDYVFDVDIEEGKPPLKLPYNVTEDPWFAAQKFLEQNDISQMFLDQVAKFIMKNTEGMTLGASQPTSAGDPFTGQTRYIPGGSGNSGFAQSSTTTGADPFTGAGRYVPSDSRTTVQSSFFPQRTLLTFDSGNLAAIIGKLKEFCTGNGYETLSDEQIEDVVRLTEIGVSCSAEAVATLQKLLRLPGELVFPALDLLRLVIRNPRVCDHFCASSGGGPAMLPDDFLTFVLSHMSPDSQPANQMLAMRTLCNMAASSPSGRHVFAQAHNAVLEVALRIVPSINRNVQIALATVLLNYAVLLLDSSKSNGASSDHFEAKVQCLSAVSCMLATITDAEAQFRLLVTVGTLTADDQDSLAFAKSLDLQPAVRKLIVHAETAGTGPNKVAACAIALDQLLT